MSRIEDLEAFIAVVEFGSLTEAGRRLDRSLQAVSRSLAALEAGVGVELIHRTTRQCVPSEAGHAFFARVKPALSELEEARLEAAGWRSEPTGILRVGAPVLFGPSYVIPIIAQFMRDYSRVEVELELTDSFSDFTAHGLDVAIRIADLPDSDLKGRRLGALRRVVFGAPAYLERYGRPSDPSDLKDHSCIVRTLGDNSGKWKFQVSGKARTVSVHGSFRTNTMTGVYSAVRAGVGLGYSPLWQIKELVDSGEVQLVLEDFEPKPVPIHALWQVNKNRLAKVRTFVDYLAERLQLDQL